MNTGLKIAVVCVTVVFLAVQGWRYWPRSAGAAPPERLAAEALGAATTQQQQQSAIQLVRASGEEARRQLRRVLRQSTVPEVRAVCIQGIGAKHDYECMDILLTALADESVLVRNQAGVTVTRMIGRDYHFPANGSPEERAKVIEAIRRCWKEMDGSRLLEIFQEKVRAEGA